MNNELIENNVSAQEMLQTDDMPIRMVGLTILLLTFGVFGTWSVVAPIDGAALAPGVVSVKAHRKTVQHLDGGIVKTIVVKEGDLVVAGDILLTLDDTQIKAHINQLKSKISGLIIQRESNHKLMLSFDEEILDLKELLAEGFADRRRLRDIERSYARGQGEIAEMTASIAGAEMQIMALNDKLVRTEIKAPAGGRVMALNFHTEGGVLRPSEPILEIVPQEELIITAQVAPLDIDRVSVGMLATVRFSAFKQALTPEVEGRLITLSADRMIDEKSGVPYFSTQVELTEESYKKLVGLELLPGMPAEVLINTGERTLFEYLTQPVSNAFAHAFIED